MQKIFIATGGTGGHIIPAQELAFHLAKNYKTYILADKKYKNYIKPEHNFKFYTINSSQITRSYFKLFCAIIKIGLGVLKSLFLIAIHRPKYIFAFGGYATFPILIASVLTRRKIILHEQNSHLGKVNKIFAKYAYKIALTFEKTDNILSNCKNKIVLTGNPIRQKILDLSNNKYELPKKIYPKSRDKMGYKSLVLSSEFQDMQEAQEKQQRFNILIIGGSGGAQIFSKILPKAFFNLNEEIKNNIEITQQCRPDLCEETFNIYEQFNLNIEIDSFFDDMPEKIAKSHLIIARSGSSSINEFLAAKKPMILVPLAKSADNHQLKNAKIIEESGAAILVEEKEFTINKIRSIIQRLLKNDIKLIEMSNSCSKISKLDATEKLVNIAND